MHTDLVITLVMLIFPWRSLMSFLALIGVKNCLFWSIWLLVGENRLCGTARGKLSKLDNALDSSEAFLLHNHASSRPFQPELNFRIETVFASWKRNFYLMGGYPSITILKCVDSFITYDLGKISKFLQRTFLFFETPKNAK